MLISHVDTQRTPFIFRTPQWVEIYKAFTTVAFVLYALQGLLYLLGAVFLWNWVWYATFPSALCAVTLVVICLQADTTPYTAVANDNASSVGMVLALAEELSLAPLEHTRVFCAWTGC